MTRGRTAWEPGSRLDDAEVKALAKLIAITAEPSEYHDKHFAVTLEGVALGTVYDGSETLERGPKGARYVTRRWTRSCWRATAYAPHRAFYWKAHRSRIRAVAALVEFALEDGGRLAVGRAHFLRKLRGQESR